MAKHRRRRLGRYSARKVAELLHRDWMGWGEPQASGNPSVRAAPSTQPVPRDCVRSRGSSGPAQTVIHASGTQINRKHVSLGARQYRHRDGAGVRYSWRRVPGEHSARQLPRRPTPGSRQVPSQDRSTRQAGR